MTPPSGTNVAITATATDDVSVANVQFQLDGSNLQSPIFSSPYLITWDSTSVADGTHTLTAVAEDGSGNFGTSSVISIKVEYTP